MRTMRVLFSGSFDWPEASIFCILLPLIFILSLLGWFKSIDQIQCMREKVWKPVIGSIAMHFDLQQPNVLINASSMLYASFHQQNERIYFTQSRDANTEVSMVACNVELIQTWRMKHRTWTLHHYNAMLSHKFLSISTPDMSFNQKSWAQVRNNWVRMSLEKDADENHIAQNWHYFLLLIRTENPTAAEEHSKYIFYFVHFIIIWWRGWFG